MPPGFYCPSELSHSKKQQKLKKFVLSLLGIDSLQPPLLLMDTQTIASLQVFPRIIGITYDKSQKNQKQRFQRWAMCSYLPVPRHKSGLSQVWYQRRLLQVLWHLFFMCYLIQSSKPPLWWCLFFQGDKLRVGGEYTKHRRSSSLNHDGALVPLFNRVNILKDGSHDHAILLCTSTPFLHTNFI